MPIRPAPAAGPAYSSTIASCTIVSSRWVAGLSTGSRPVSAMMTITSATNASTPVSDATWPGMVERVGHQRTEIGRSGRDGQREDRQQNRRLDQCGDGDLAACAHARRTRYRCRCRPGSTRRCRGTADRRRRTGRRPDPAATRWPRSARSRRSAAWCPATIAGAAANTTVVPCGVICCLPSCLRRSRQGCSSPPPARPSQRGRTCRIRPITSGAPIITATDLRGARDVGHHVHLATTSTISTPSAP